MTPPVEVEACEVRKESGLRLISSRPAEPSLAYLSLV